MEDRIVPCSNKAPRIKLSKYALEPVLFDILARRKGMDVLSDLTGLKMKSSKHRKFLPAAQSRETADRSQQSSPLTKRPSAVVRPQYDP